MAKRIAIFLPSFVGGGAERSMVTLAYGLVDRGYKVDLLVARAEGPYKALVDQRVRIVDLQALRVLFSLPKLVRYLRLERPEALLSTLDYANVIALWARRLAHVPTRTVVLEQNTISITARKSLQWRQRIMPRLVRRFYAWADHVVGNSYGVAEDLVKITGLPRERVEVIYNPVVTSTLREKAKFAPHHPWFGPGNPPVILAVGRLTEQKDFPTLIRAFAEVHRKLAVRLLILGEGRDREELQALIDGLGVGSDVLLAGFVENPYAYMAGSAAFVLSSRWEGLPTVLIEAMASGTRVIATDCPSGPREILADGKHGALVPVENVTSLAEAISAALAKKITKPSTDSWRRFELGTVVDQYVSILCGKSGGSNLRATA